MAARKKDRPRKARVLIVDDHAMVRYGIGRILQAEEDLSVCGEAGDGHDALRAIESLKPDLVLLDLSLKRFDGIQILKILHSERPLLPILVLSMHDEEIYACRALRAGARGYVMKDESSEKLVAAIRHVLQGEIAASDRIKRSLLDGLTSVPNSRRHAAHSPVDALSDRERQIFLLLGQGYTSKTIAGKLMLSIKTVETHRARMKVKLGIQTTGKLIASAAEWASREGVTGPGQ